MDFKKQLLLLKASFEKSDITALKRLSAVFADGAFEDHQEENIDLSIVAYACAKFLEKPYVVDNPDWKDFRKNLLYLLTKAIEDFSAGKDKAGFARIRDSVKLIQTLGEDLGRFAFGVIEKARLKAGAEIYAKGASLGAAVEISGSEKQELASYISSTKMPGKYVTKSVAQRLQETKKIFS